MASSFDIDAAPLDGLAQGLDAAGDRLADPGPMLKDATAEVQRLAAPRTPRQTGRLAGSVQATVAKDAGIIRWGVGYAVYVNFGTRTMRARPFATDALAGAESAVETRARQWAADALEVVG